jgi:hypothetical protein
VRKILVEKNVLEKLIADNKRLSEISKILNCAPGTVKNYIKKYNIIQPPGFCSSSKKRGRPKGIPWTQEQKEKHSKINSGKGNPFYGKKHNKKTKEKMSRNHADFNGDKNPFRIASRKNPKLLKDLGERTKKQWAKLSKEEKYNRTKQNIFGDISKYHWSRTMRNAAFRGIDFDILPEDAWELWVKQKGKCALSGVDLNLKTCDEITASLDRMDSNLGYLKNNIQWTHKDLNQMKMILTNQQFIDWCIKIVNYQKKCGNI